MLICIPEVLSKQKVAQFREVDRGRRMGGRPLDGGLAVFARQEQFATAAK